MELMSKKGFKQTEVGLMPEDWEVKKFDEFGLFFKGKGIKKDEVKLQGSPCVRYGELYTKYDNVIRETYSFIKQSVAKESVKLKRGDLLFAGSGETREEIGKSAVILRDDTFAGGDIVVFRPRNVDSVFLGFMSNSTPVTKQKAINGQGDAVVHIYSRGISKIQIPIPPTLTEQKAIATALSGVDELIASLDKLIEKKKAIKQGAMQELLGFDCAQSTTPRRRLPGFSGEWEEKTLGEVAEIVGGGTPRSSNKNFWKGKINWFTPTEIGNEKYVFESNRKITKEGLDKSSAKMLPVNTVLLTSRAGIGDVAIIKTLSCTNQGFQSLIAKENVSHEYLYYLIQQLRPILMEKASGSTFLEISPNQIRAMNYFFPKLNEQKAIAQILSDMDAEIEALEAKKAKYQDIKQGMMQELLTGKTRLV